MRHHLLALLLDFGADGLSVSNLVMLPLLSSDCYAGGAIAYNSASLRAALDALGQPFRAPAWQRWLGRCLLRLLGIPGVARGLVKLHARRTRQRS